MAMQLFAQWRGKPELWTIDWFRHVRERIDPVDHLTRPYFDQWAQCLFAILVDNGTVTLQIAFAAADLWPEAASRRDMVYVDLWESYPSPHFRGRGRPVARSPSHLAQIWIGTD
jgi:hypothetical protein